MNQFINIKGDTSLGEDSMIFAETGGDASLPTALQALSLQEIEEARGFLTGLYGKLIANSALEPDIDTLEVAIESGTLGENEEDMDQWA